MKKSFLYLCCFFALFSGNNIFAYTSDDVTIANSLADADIIVPHKNNLDAYRLDETISRQEVIGMALKLKGVALPLTYDCKGYFTDANFSKESADAWVCRAVELAADRGLITQENKITRPRDNITKAEALAMIWKGAGMDTNVSTTLEKFYDANNVVAVQWQEDLLQSARIANIISPTRTGDKWFWKHNTPATRKEIFAIISKFQALKDIGKKIPHLSFMSGEAEYVPGNTKILSSDATLVKDIQDKNFDSLINFLGSQASYVRID